jgi:Saccharopine dehydrogenase and related proteins
MKVLVVGTGAVGAAVAAVAKRRSFFERMTFADLDPARPAAVVERDGDDRFAAAQVDAGDRDALVRSCARPRRTPSSTRQTHASTRRSSKPRSSTAARISTWR